MLLFGPLRRGCILFFQVLSMRYSVLISPPIKNLVFGLYRSFKVSSSVLINRLKSLVGLYISIIRLRCFSSTAQISRSFSLQLFEISIWLTCMSLQTKIHTPPSAGYYDRNCILIHMLAT